MNQNLKYKSFCFTGTLATMTRKQAQSAIEARGGTFSNNVQYGLSYLVVANDKPGATKLMDASDKGVKKLTEAEFINMLQEKESKPACPNVKIEQVKVEKVVPQGPAIFEVREW